MIERRCPWCGLIVRADDATMTVAHEVPVCPEFATEVERKHGERVPGADWTRTTFIAPENAPAEACCIAELVDVDDVDGAVWTCPECRRVWRCRFFPAETYDQARFEWETTDPTPST